MKMNIIADNTKEASRTKIEIPCKITVFLESFSMCGLWCSHCQEKQIRVGHKQINQIRIIQIVQCERHKHPFQTPPHIRGLYCNPNVITHLCRF